jgi:hypothetical protein
VSDVKSVWRVRIHYCIPKDDRELDTEDTDDVDMSQSSLEDTIIAEDRPESVLPVTTGTQPLDVACQQSIPAEEGELLDTAMVSNPSFSASGSSLRANSRD